MVQQSGTKTSGSTCVSKPIEVCANCPAIFKLDYKPGMRHGDDFLMAARTRGITGSASV